MNKEIYLDKKQLCDLRDKLWNIIEDGITNVYLKLRDYIYNSNNYTKNFEGEYLSNIFDDEELMFLEKLDEKYNLNLGGNL